MIGLLRRIPVACLLRRRLCIRIGRRLCLLVGPRAWFVGVRRTWRGCTGRRTSLWWIATGGLRLRREMLSLRRGVIIALGGGGGTLRLGWGNEGLAVVNGGVEVAGRQFLWCEALRTCGRRPAMRLRIRIGRL